ncbi:MAG TPA: hypothetical protein PKV27_05090 [Ilumatobacteraceae bacterium]|nr:hypothetical protein [Ilumatobacteraceae bacterium]
MYRALVAAAVVLTTVAGCSDGAKDTTPSSLSTTTVPAATDAALPRVDLIHPAVRALEGQLGGPQRFFEINATTKLVNLFLSLNNGTMSQAWVFFDGELSSQEAKPASGHTFASSALTFDGATVLDRVREELPTTRLQLFEILGGANDAVQFTIGATSSEGGGLIITVNADGRIATVAAA